MSVPDIAGLAAIALTIVLAYLLLREEENGE